MKIKVLEYVIVIVLVSLDSINSSCDFSGKSIYSYSKQGSCYVRSCFYNNIRNLVQVRWHIGVCYKIIITSSNIVHFSSTVIDADDPVYYIKIQNSFLTTIEKRAFNTQRLSELQEIHFPHNNLTKIEKGVFVDLRYLEVLNLTQNQIETVEDRAFETLEKLTSLDLSENRLKSIGQEYFVGLLNLNTLLLNGNSISIIKSNTLDGFNTLRSLVFLNLAQNQIDTVENNAFETLQKLTSLDLSENRLKSIGAKYFVGLSKLNSLLLHKNRISTIEANAFIDLNELAVLNLQDFQIKSLVTNTFAGLTNVHELLLPTQSIQEVEDMAFIGLRNLPTLDLSHQNLTKIVANTFIGLSNSLTLSKNSLDSIEAATFNGTQLRYIDLSFTALSVIATNFTRDLVTIVSANFSFNTIRTVEVDNFDFLLNLTALDLSHNLIEAIPVGYFGHLNLLEHLDLSHNLITSLELGTFVGLVRLKSLYFSHNKITILPTIVLHNTPNLLLVDLGDNLITNIEPLKLKQFTNLRTININNNFFDCNTLSQIIQQFKSLGVEIVYGTTRKITGIHGVVCRVDVKSTQVSLANETANPQISAKNYGSRLTEKLLQLLEANAQLQKDALLGQSDTSKQMFDAIKLFKDVVEKMKEDQTERSNYSQRQNVLQNHDDITTKCFTAKGLETQKATTIDAVSVVNLMCLFVIILLLAVISFRKITIFKNKNFFRRGSSNEEQIML